VIEVGSARANLDEVLLLAQRVPAALESVAVRAVRP
jgi:hypothetical protein